MQKRDAAHSSQVHDGAHYSEILVFNFLEGYRRKNFVRFGQLQSLRLELVHIRVLVTGEDSFMIVIFSFYQFSYYIVAQVRGQFSPHMVARTGLTRRWRGYSIATGDRK